MKDAWELNCSQDIRVALLHRCFPRPATETIFPTPGDQFSFSMAGKDKQSIKEKKKKSLKVIHNFP